MNSRFMISVATAALIAGAGFAHAQGTGMGREGSPAGSSAQQSAPSSGNSAAPANRGATESTSPSSDMKATQSEDKSPGAAKNQRAEDKNMQGQKSKSMSSETEGAKGNKEMKAEGREGSKDMKAQGHEGSKDMKAQGHEGSKDMKAQSREGQSQTGQTGQAQSREGQSQTGQTGQSQSREGQSQIGQTGQSQTTVGQAGAAAKLSTEQRTKITTVIRDQRVQPLNNVNFSISVGTRVPRDVRFHPLPREVVTIYPEWRGYEFVLVKEQIVVVDPRTFEIVAILEA
ncbi:DUF1236 domain-containing protein [Bradyrhizobium sp. URHD0069]|uniref:DUF1236 domain-containing protein n=1 Tax=Bradyrhizobium sp. URHD0069 TaxID=1380355 RepID=UPI0004979D0A|nr:DUF1236 domain-containing protein [Bradyrhizobium sp. URHD0069]